MCSGALETSWLAEYRHCLYSDPIEPQAAKERGEMEGEREGWGGREREREWGG